MTDNLNIETRLHAPPLPETHALKSVLTAALKTRPVPRPTSETPVYWPAPYFRLNQVSLFREADEETRQHVLTACSRSVFAEAYYIEKSGMYFAAKMALLAETTDERMLYSLFGAARSAPSRRRSVRRRVEQAGREEDELKEWRIPTGDDFKLRLGEQPRGEGLLEFKRVFKLSECERRDEKSLEQNAGPPP